MNRRSAYQSVDLVVLRAVAPSFDIEVEEGYGGDVWIDRMGKTFMLEVHEGSVYGESMYHGLITLGVDVISFYIAVTRQRGDPPAEPDAAPT